jgi:predicted metalloprotease with PDZ domain
MYLRFVGLALVTALLQPAGKPAAPAPEIRYAVRIDSAHLDVVEVAISIRNVTGAVWLAMKVHPEYDAKYWRYVEDIRVSETRDDTAAWVRRSDSTRWQVRMPGGRGVVRYRVHVQPSDAATRRAWKPFMRATGGLLNSPDVFLYLPDYADAPVTLSIDAPKSWRMATALEGDGTAYRAADAAEFLDSPILMGALRTSPSGLGAVGGGPVFHYVYWPLPDAVPFDFLALQRALQLLAVQTLQVFAPKPPVSASVPFKDAAPVAHYWFLMEDGADDALEHRGSVTIGVPSATLARDQRAMMTTIAHEFFHTWNLVAIHPDDYLALSYRAPVRTTGLWFGEGVTLYYADALTRRAGIVDTTPTRLEHLAQLATSYQNAWWAPLVSPARASLAFEDSPALNRDATGGYYLQGELLGHALDALVRDSTADARTLDDVMRALYVKSRGGRGYSERELEATIDSVCGCHTRRFFEMQVDGTSPIDISPALKRIGMTLVVDTAIATDRDGNPAPDARVSMDFSRETGPIQLVVGNPVSVWYRSGLRTGDVLRSLNGKAVNSSDAFFAVTRGIHVGDTVVAEVERSRAVLRVPVIVTAYPRARVRFVEAPGMTEVQRARRARWTGGR